jgi:hypothetical protein
MESRPEPGPGAVVGQLTDDVGARFRLTILLPVALPVLVTTALVLGGAPAHAPSLERLLHREREAGLAGIVALAAVIVVLSIIVSAVQTALTRLLEGYWGDSRLARRFRDAAVERLRNRRDALAGAKMVRTAGRPATEKELNQMQHALEHLSGWPQRDRVQPTRLGCALRAGEDRAGDRYGLDAVLLWPRLYAVVAAPLRSTLDAARDRMDLLVMTTWSSAISALIALALLARQGWWLLLPLFLIVVAWLSYRAAVTAAHAYGLQMQVAFDLHRFDLLAALHVPLPGDSQAEPKIYKPIQQLLSRGCSAEESPLVYSHPEPAVPTRPGLSQDPSCSEAPARQVN